MSVPRDRARRGKRGGFTLLELLVVLALLVALGGLTMPALLARVGGAGRDAVEVRLRSAASLCRAEAQRTGQSRELVALLIGGEAVIVSREVSDSDSQAAGEVLVELPSGYRFRGLEDSGEAQTPDEMAEQGQSGEPRVLAEYLPDGSAVVPERSFLEFGGLVLEVRISRWTGSFSLVAVVDPARTDESEEADEGGGWPDAGMADGEDQP